jgi:cation diffusion facilitator family transporter
MIKCSKDKCQKCAGRVIWIGLAVAVTLSAVKLVVGYMGGSSALIGSGMCNLSDVTASLAMLFGAEYSSKPKSIRHPYGLGKLEFLTQVGISGFMILGNAAVILSSMIHIGTRTIIVPHMFVFFVALLSALVDTLIFKYSHCVAHQLNSPAFRADAEHHKIDIVSEFCVAGGVLITRAGFHWVDPLIAIFECGHVFHGSWDLFWDGLRGLTDANAKPETIDKIRRRVAAVEDIKKVVSVRARSTGTKMLVDLAVEVDPEISVLDSKKVAMYLKHLLMKHDEHVENVFVQILPVR